MKKKMQAWLAQLEGSRWSSLVQFVKFGLVGVSNTLISYATEMLGYYVLLTSLTSEPLKVTLVTGASFLVSTVNAYYWNNRYVFKGNRHTLAQHMCAYLRTAACYALTGLLLAPAVKVWLVNINVPFWAASLSTLILTIPLNFILNKFWAFRK